MDQIDYKFIKRSVWEKKHLSVLCNFIYLFVLYDIYLKHLIFEYTVVFEYITDNYIILPTIIINYIMEAQFTNTW